MDTKWIGRHFWYFKELASTNVYVKAKKNPETPDGLTCIADCQKHGRGLYGKNWNAEPNLNLTFTVVFKPRANDCLQTLNLMAAFSICDVLYQNSGLEYSIKWPNDVYYSKQKIGGLLTETSYTGNFLDRILVGIGININQREFTGELQEKACSLSSIMNKNDFSREIILAQILNQIERNYNDWEHKNDLLIKSINRKIIGYGEWVNLQIDGKVKDEKFKILGVNSLGYLNVLSKDDEIKVFTHEQVRIHSKHDMN